MLRNASAHQIRYRQRMRTTIDLDADVLAAAKEIAQHRRPTPVPLELTERGGFFVLPKRAGVVITSDMVKRLAEDEG